MPSGKTHDTITLLLAAPTFVAAWVLSRSLALAAALAAATVLGGLMFGPDLDTHSKQYTRWGIFRFLWLPYQIIFRHRSRWSHGILFGTLIRVAYFAAVLTLPAAGGVYVRAVFVAGTAPEWGELWRAWDAIRAGAETYGVGARELLAVFAGLWWGAAIHTLADVGWSMLKKGTEIF